MTGLLLLVGALLGSIDGRVVSAAGEPVAGAVVRIDALERSARTGEAGAFRLDAIPSGRWALTVEAAGYRRLDLAVLVPEADVVRLDVELTPADAELASPTLQGALRDASNLEPVSGAVIEVVGSGLRAMSAADGAFTLDLPVGAWTLRVEAAGYRPLEREVVMASGPLGVDLLLDIQPLPIPGLTVGGARSAGPAGATRPEAPSAWVVDSTVTRLMPTAAERDIFRSLQILPSVTPSSDFSTALFVRGGTPDQTRILLDGFPVYNPYHVGGFASAFAPEAVAASTLSPGGLPASAPSSLAGVLDIGTVEAGGSDTSVSGGLGLLSSSVTVDRPLPVGRGGLLVSARRTYLDAATGAADALGLIQNPVPYGFTDGLLKLRVPLGTRGELTALGYVDRESFDIGDENEQDIADVDWGSDVAGVLASLPVGARSRIDLRLGTSGFHGDLLHLDDVTPIRPEPVPVEPSVDTSSLAASLRTVHGQADLEARRGAHLLAAGIRWESTAVDHRFRPRNDEAQYVPPLNARGDFGSLAFYLRDRWSSDPWTLDLGLRTERPSGRSWYLQPRLRVERRFGTSTRLALFGGRYVQDRWSLRNEEAAWAAAVGYDLLAPVPGDRAPPTSWDAGLELRTRLGRWGARLDAYHKSLRAVPTALPSVDPLREPVVVVPNDVRIGDGRVDGVEVAVGGSWGETAMAIAYRWQRERRTLGGSTFTPRTDRRHRLVLSGTRPFWGERELALSVTWMSGVPVTPVEAVLPDLVGVDSHGRTVAAPVGQPTPIVYGSRNAGRLPAYLRVDLETRGAWDLTLFGRRGLIEPYISVLNVMNHHNALVAEHFGNGSRVVRETGPQLPVFPSFGLRWRF